MKKILISLALFLPVLTLAANGSGNFDSFLNNFAGWVDTIGKIMFAAVFIGFFYGLLIFMINEDKREEGKKLMLWGFIALFIMASIWGLIKFVGTSIGISDSENASGHSDIIPKASGNQ